MRDGSTVRAARTAAPSARTDARRCRNASGHPLMRATHAGRGRDHPERAGGSPAAAGRPLKRSFTIGGHRTSISLEAAFWEALQDAAARESAPVSRLIARIDADREGCGLSSAVRVWLLAHYRNSASPGGG